MSWITIRRTGIAVLSSLIFLPVLANIPDSLLLRIQNIPADSTRLNTWIVESKNYAPNNFDLSLGLAQEGLKDAKKVGNQSQIAFAYKSIALAHGYHGDPHQARDYYLKAAEIFGLLGERILVADMYMNSGVEFYYAENYDSSMSYYLKALPVYEELGEAQSLGRIYNNMATNYRSLGMSEKAIVYFRRSLKYKAQIKDESGVMNTNLNIANLYRLEDRIDSALIYSREALSMAMNLNDRSTEGLIRQVICLSYIDLEELDSAKTEGILSERLLSEAGDSRNLARINASLASLFFKMDDCDSARYYAEQFNALNPGLKMYREKREISKLLGACAFKSGDFERAYLFRTQELLFDDSVDAVEQQERLGAITAKYEESVRNSEFLEKENQLTAAEAERNRLFAFASASIAGLALAIILLIVITQRNRKRKAKQEDKIRIQVSEIEKLRNKLAIQAELEPQLESNTPMSLEEVNSHLINPLTERELEVLKAIAEGKSNQQIADELFVSINTIKTHVNKIYDKLDVNNRTQATLKASELKLVN